MVKEVEGVEGWEIARLGMKAGIPRANQGIWKFGKSQKRSMGGELGMGKLGGGIPKISRGFGEAIYVHQSPKTV